MLSWVQCTRSRRRLVFLSPADQRSRTVWFGDVQNDQSRHEELLAGAQRLRGAIYLKDGAIASSDLTADGRHVQAADDLSYHILTVDDRDNVLGCMRYRVHPTDVKMGDLALSRSAVALSATWGPFVREAVEAQIEAARVSGLAYVELGAWAISESLRSGVDAIRMLLSVYALARGTGGAMGITTATSRHHSSSILRRMGGESLALGGRVVPRYFDPHFKCEMELLRFHSSAPNPQYVDLIANYQQGLSESPLILRTPMARRNPEASASRICFHALPEAAPLV